MRARPAAPQRVGFVDHVTRLRQGSSAAVVDVDPDNVLKVSETGEPQTIGSGYTKHPLVRLRRRLRSEPVVRSKQGADGLERDVNQVAQREIWPELVAIGNDPSLLRRPALDAVQQRFAGGRHRVDHRLWVQHRAGNG